MTPDRTQYARNDDGAYLAYQVTGNGPIDLLTIFGPGLNIEDQLAGRYSGPFIERPRLGTSANPTRCWRKSKSL